MTTTMRPGEEHLVKDKSGALLGLYRLDVDKARQHYGLWDGVEALVQEYVKLHPQEVALAVAENKQTKDIAYNKFSSTKGNAMRHSLSLPPGLMFKLEQFEPTLFTNRKTLHEFMRRYEGFRACQTV